MFLDVNPIGVQRAGEQQKTKHDIQYKLADVHSLNTIPYFRIMFNIPIFTANNDKRKDRRKKK